MYGKVQIKKIRVSTGVIRRGRDCFEQVFGERQVQVYKKYLAKE